MNKEYILYHLKEAQEQLLESISGLESDPEYDIGEFLPDMSHLYHHINTAWNAREASEAAAANCSEADFNSWRKMPSSIDLLLMES